MSVEELKTQFGDKLTNLETNSVKRSELDSLLNEIKHTIKDNKDKGKANAEEFIEHMTSCDDKTC